MILQKERYIHSLRMFKFNPTIIMYHWKNENETSKCKRQETGIVLPTAYLICIIAQNASGEKDICMLK